jgi:hypothetical protein
MKFSQWIGVVACITLVASGFMNWTWYPDLHKFFTGYYTQNNIYGKPAKFFAILAVLAIIFFLVPKVWAKRWNILICAFIVAYAVKTFILFTTCYRGVCPQKQPGIWIMLVSSFIIMLSGLLPDLKVQSDEPPGENST